MPTLYAASLAAIRALPGARHCLRRTADLRLVSHLDFGGALNLRPTAFSIAALPPLLQRRKDLVFGFWLSHSETGDKTGADRVGVFGHAYVPFRVLNLRYHPIIASPKSTRQRSAQNDAE